MRKSPAISSAPISGGDRFDRAGATNSGKQGTCALPCGGTFTARSDQPLWAVLFNRGESVGKPTAPLSATVLAFLIASLAAACSGEPPAVRSSVTWVAYGGVEFGRVLAASGGVGAPTLVIGNGAHSDPQVTWLRTNTSDPEASEIIHQCRGRLGCGYPTLAAAYMKSAASAESGEDCFAFGLKAIGDGVSMRRQGVVNLWCSDGREVTYPMVDFAAPLDQLQVSFAADSAEQPLLMTGSAALETAWYYPPGFSQPVTLQPAPGVATESFGSSVAVVRLGSDRFSSRLLAVGAPTRGEVWLFRSEFPQPEEPKRVGCLGPRKAFGRNLASGDVNGDGVDELLVADEQFVTAFSGSALAVLSEQAGDDCSLAGLPDAAVIASVSCASGGKTSGCSRSSFGAAIAVADIDGDADGEIIVGAPGMTLTGVGQVGAVLVFDAEGAESHQLTEQFFDVDLAVGAAFGRSLQTLKGRNTDYVAVGAPGAGAVALLRCFALTPKSLRPDSCP